MRNVLVVLFWLWVLVAVGVYASRIYRRVAHGPKRARSPRPADSPGTGGPTGSTTAGSGHATGPGGTSGPTTDRPRRSGLFASLSTPPPTPLPEGPVEARLPKALQDLTPPTGEGAGVDPTPVAPADGAADATATGPTPPRAPLPTLAEALQGIRMPDALLPVVDTTEVGLDDQRRARFAGTGTNVPAVAAELGEELKRLGYAVDGLDTVTSSRAGLSAHRDGTTVAASVAIDDDTGAVVVDLGI